MASSTPVPLAYKSVDPKVGAKDKAPIIFLHGMSGSKENWDKLSQPVADATGRKVYAIDARNHGDTAWSDVFNFDVNVDDLLHFMDTMKIPKAILIGQSMGGLTGIKTALRAPERVEKLVVEDMSAKKPPQALVHSLLGLMQLAKSAIDSVPVGVDELTAKKCLIEFLKKTLPPEFQSKILSDPRELPWQLKQDPDGRYTFKADYNSFENALRNWENSMTEITGVYKGPACFIYGKISEFRVHLDEEYNKQFIPNAEFVGIENASHGVYYDCPQEYTDALLKFLQRE